MAKTTTTTFTKMPLPEGYASPAIRQLVTVNTVSKGITDFAVLQIIGGSETRICAAPRMDAAQREHAQRIAQSFNLHFDSADGDTEYNATLASFIQKGTALRYLEALRRALRRAGMKLEQNRPRTTVNVELTPCTRLKWYYNEQRSALSVSLHFYENSYAGSPADFAGCTLDVFDLIEDNAGGYDGWPAEFYAAVSEFTHVPKTQQVTQFIEGLNTLRQDAQLFAAQSERLLDSVKSLRRALDNLPEVEVDMTAGMPEAVAKLVDNPFDFSLADYLKIA